VRGQQTERDHHGGKAACRRGAVRADRAAQRESGASVRLRDVGGSSSRENYTTVSFYNGRRHRAWRCAWPPAPTRSTRRPVKAKGQTTWRSFPAGTEARRSIRHTPFIRLSIREVVKTLLEAFVLVFLVMYLFLAEHTAPR